MRHIAFKIALVISLLLTLRTVVPFSQLLQSMSSAPAQIISLDSLPSTATVSTAQSPSAYSRFLLQDVQPLHSQPVILSPDQQPQLPDPQQPQVPQTQQPQAAQTQQHQPLPSEESHYHFYHPSQLRFWVNILVVCGLTCVGAFCSGMTVGMMSIEPIQMEIMSMSQDENEKNVARRILPLLNNHHLLLVTLLLANAMALETLPIIVHNLMPAWAAILFSTLIVLIGAEIIPQAFCTGPKKVTIAYHAAPVINFMIKFFWILGYPMAKGLDYLLGEHHHQRIQHKDFANFLTGGSQILKNTEKLLLTSILELRTKRVPQIMVQLSDLYMLSLKDRLTASKIKEINSKDYSYILVYKQTKTNVVGVIKMKQFAIKYLKSSRKDLTVEDLFTQNQDILCVYEDTNLLEMLMLFQARNARYSLVIGKKKKIEPGIQSIMYSKSDMVANKQQAEILGVVFLYKIFDSVAEYNNQVASALHIDPDGNHNQRLHDIEMAEINRPLLH